MVCTGIHALIAQPVNMILQKGDSHNISSLYGFQMIVGSLLGTLTLESKNCIWFTVLSHFDQGIIRVILHYQNNKKQLLP